MGAIDRFDPYRGVPFAAFAGPTILGELRRHFRDRVWTLRVPRGLQERIRDVEDSITKLGSDLERSPTVAEVADELGIEDDVLEAMEAGDARRTISLDQPAVGDDLGDSSIGDRVGGEDPGYELVEERSAITAGARVLTDLEREVLRLRFVEDLTQSKIAEQVGYSQMHVSRILRRALERAARGLRARRPRLDWAPQRLGLRSRAGGARVAVALDADLVGERLERGVDLGDPQAIKQCSPPPSTSGPTRTHRTPRRPRRRGRGRSRPGSAGVWAEIASPSSTASESRSTEKLARTAKIEMIRESTGPTSSPAGIDISAPRRRRARARALGSQRAAVREISIRIVTSVPRSGPR